jgi:hypothetical protein
LFIHMPSLARFLFHRTHTRSSCFSPSASEVVGLRTSAIWSQ